MLKTKKQSKQPKSMLHLKDEKGLDLELVNGNGSPFDFTVRKEPVEYWKDGELKDSSDSQVQLVDNNDKLLHVVGSNYGIVQPNRFVSMITDSLEGINFLIDSVMSFSNRCKQVVSIKLEDETVEVKKGDHIQANLIFLNSFDGSWRTSVTDSITRLWCLNQLNHLRNSSVLNLTAKHTVNVCDKLYGIQQAVATLAVSRQGAIKTLVESMDYSLSLSQANNLIAGFLNSTSTRAENTRESIVSLFSRGIENKGDNLYDLFNGVTEYYTHHAVGENVKNREEKQLISSQFGTGGKKKSDFFNALRVKGELSNEAIDSLANKGERLIKDRELIKVS